LDAHNLFQLPQLDGTGQLVDRQPHQQTRVSRSEGAARVFPPFCHSFQPSLARLARFSDKAPAPIGVLPGGDGQCGCHRLWESRCRVPCEAPSITSDWRLSRLERGPRRALFNNFIKKRLAAPRSHC
jgi:hypothetical protein